MADLNALIAQGAQFRQPTDPFAQYGQLQQLESARQANALNMMKMDEYRRGIQEQNALRSSIASDFDINNPAHVNAVLRASPSAGASFLEKFSQGAKERELAAKAKNEALKFNLDNSRSLLVGVNDQPSYDSWRAYSIKNMPELAQILPAQFSQESKSALLTTADDISKRLTAAPSYQSVAPSHTLTKDGVPIYTAAAAPEKASAPPSMVAEYTFAKTPEGGGYVGSFEKFVRDRAIAARPPGAPRQEAAPVAVVDPATGKQIFVSREEALRNRMTPASAMENLAPKEIQKREAALPQATSAVQGFESKSDKFIADLMALRDHPGLSSITGIAAGRMPGLTSEGRAAQALYDKVVAKGGFQALQDLRDASKTGGALGNVSNQEGKQLTASFAAIDRRQDAPDVKAAIDQAIADIQGSKTRMREAYDATYSYKSGATPTTPPAVVPGRTPAPAVVQGTGGFKYLGKESK